jgi:hypothetical protein
MNNDLNTHIDNLFDNNVSDNEKRIILLYLFHQKDILSDDQIELILKLPNLRIKGFYRINYNELHPGLFRCAKSVYIK